MKKAALLLLLLPAVALSQQSTAEPAPEGTVPTSVNFPVETVTTPNMADLYCAGFVGKNSESKDKFVTGGLESPFTTQYGNGEAIFLNGHGYQAGQEYMVIRELVDPNRYEMFPGQWSAVKAAGHPFEELARIQIIDTRSKMAIARVEFSCDAVLPGDFVVPFVDKQSVAFHPSMRFDRFLPASGQLTGRIIMAKDFDSQLGTGGKVYLNIGSNQGLKVGDFVRAERSFAAASNDPVDSLSFDAGMVDMNQAHQPTMVASSSYKFVPMPGFMNHEGGPEVHIAQMPRKAVGEIVIVGTTPTTATGMVVFALEPVYVGDRVELDRQ